MDFKSVLITGGAGFIGVNFARMIANATMSRITVLDALTYAASGSSLDEVISDRVGFVHGDIRDSALVEEVMAEQEVDCVVHFAAESHVDRSITGPDEFISTNIGGTHNLLKAAKKIDPKWTPYGPCAQTGRRAR